MKLSTHQAILLLNELNRLKVDFAKLPDGTLLTRQDCLEVLDQLCAN